jgi:hypothetical protein
MKLVAWGYRLKIADPCDMQPIRAGALISYLVASAAASRVKTIHNGIVRVENKGKFAERRNKNTQVPRDGNSITLPSEVISYWMM